MIPLASGRGRAFHAAVRTLRLWIGYDGSGLAGWQRQAGAESVQEHLERAVRLVTGERAGVHGAGRTDAGVHAFLQAAHVRVEGGPPERRFHLALNAHLPPAIRVLAALEVPSDFHARFSARGKRYLYRVAAGRIRHPLLARFVHFHAGPLDLGAMREAARLLVGTHDFLSFATNPGHPRKRPTIRTVRALHLRLRRGVLGILVEGDGFLYNQVRAMAGTLLEVGRGRRPPSWVREVLEARDRSRGGPTLPARGLVLWRVLYPPRFGGDGLPSWVDTPGLWTP